MLLFILEKRVASMKNFVTFLLEKMAAILGRLRADKKPPVSPRCSFCGETGHTVDDCPNASKYKLFNVDRD